MSAPRVRNIVTPHNPTSHPPRLHTPSMIDELVTGLVEREQAVLRELVRLAELNTAQALAEPAFHAASMSIRAQLRAHSAKVEELELLASEQDRAADVEQAMRHVIRHRNEGATLQASLRDLGGKVRAGRAQQEAAERSALLLGTPSPADGGAASGGLNQRKLSDRAATQKATPLSKAWPGTAWHGSLASDLASHLASHVASHCQHWHDKAVPPLATHGHFASDLALSLCLSAGSVAVVSQ